MINDEVKWGGREKREKWRVGEEEGGNRVAATLRQSQTKRLPLTSRVPPALVLLPP